MAKSERSAGIIVFRISQKEVQYLLLDSGTYWDFPKGHLEECETDSQAAARELTEETGIDDAEIIHDFAHEIRYFFRVKKSLVFKTVIYFLARTHKKKIHLSKEHVGFEFLTYEEARKRLSYANSRELLRLAKTRLNDMPIPPAPTK